MQMRILFDIWMIVETISRSGIYARQIIHTRQTQTYLS